MLGVSGSERRATERCAHLDGALLDLWHARVTAELFERENKRRHGGRWCVTR